MAQTIQITVTPDMEKALRVLRQKTMGKLNTIELIKLAVGTFAKVKTLDNDADITPEEMDYIAARSFYEWAKEDGTLEVNNIAQPEKLKPFVPKPYVRTR